MGDKTATLVAIGGMVSLAAVFIYFALRNVFANRNAEDGVDTQVPRRRSVGSSGKSAADTGGMSDLASQMVSEWQAQAKRSDDARKAGIRAHVERQVPPITPEGQSAIVKGQHARLAIKHIFPPRLPQRSMSYFGGLPIVPDEFDWPTLHNREGLLERLNFMAQIDCSDLPAGPARDLLPEKGYLYFFAPMSLSFGPDAMHFVTRYEPGPATKKWEPLDMPVTGTIASGDAADEAWRGKRTHYDRVEVEFGWIEEPTDEEVAARLDEGHAFEVAEKIRAEKLEAFYGPPVEHDPLLSASNAPRDALWIPYEGFPANWKTARILRRFVETYHREELDDVTRRLEGLGDVAEDDEGALKVHALRDEISMFYMKVSAAFSATYDARVKEYEAPPPEVKEKIMDLLEDLRVNGMPSSKERPYSHLALPMVIRDWLQIAAVQGAEEGLTHPDGVVLIPPEVVSALSYRHASREHHMFGEGVVVQVAADDMKDRYLLLLQLGRDPALGWLVGEMGPLQYWITPEDLAARRFENTVLTLEAY